jgi:hypothetical protein
VAAFNADLTLLRREHGRGPVREALQRLEAGTGRSRRSSGMLKVMREWSSARLLESSTSANYAMKILPRLKMNLNDDENDGAHVV